MPMLAQPSALCRSVTLAAWKPVDLNMVEHVMTCHSGRRGWTDLTAPATVGHASWDPSLSSTFFPQGPESMRFCVETCSFTSSSIL